MTNIWGKHLSNEDEIHAYVMSKLTKCGRCHGHFYWYPIKSARTSDLCGVCVSELKGVHRKYDWLCYDNAVGSGENGWRLDEDAILMYELIESLHNNGLIDVGEE